MALSFEFCKFGVNYTTWGSEKIRLEKTDNFLPKMTYYQDYSFDMIIVYNMMVTF